MIQSSAARITELGTSADLPFVAWFNYLNRSDAVITSSRPVLTDGALANAASGTTYDYWMPSIPASTTATYEVNFTSASIHASFGAIVGHNLGTLGGNVRIQSSPDGATWTDAGAGIITPTDDSPIGFRMLDAGSANQPYWRFQIANLTAGDVLYVACLYLGQEEVFPVGIYDGFAPPIFPTDVQLQSNVSVGGNLLGSSIIAQGTSLSATFQYLPPAFVRTTIADFIPTFNAGGGFFFAWRPVTFTGDLRYCWREGATIVPTNSGGLDYMSMSLNMRAYEG